jgi:hypothetical protein
LLATKEAPGGLSRDDLAELRLAAHCIFDGGLSCGVEVERPGRFARWELQVLVLPGGSVEQVEDAANESARLDPGRRVRVSPYVPESLERVDETRTVVCHEPAA